MLPGISGNDVHPVLNAGRLGLNTNNTNFIFSHH